MKAEEKASKKRNINKDERDTLLPRIRVESRREYLKKREPQQITKLRQEIADFEVSFILVEQPSQ